MFSEMPLAKMASLINCKDCKNEFLNFYDKVAIFNFFLGTWTGIIS